jgi:hypothetical protein
MVGLVGDGSQIIFPGQELRMNEVPPKPTVILPRLGDDTPADRPQRKWEEFFWPNPIPPRPEAFDLLLIEVDRHRAYVKAHGKESIAGEQAWRAMIATKVKIGGLVTIATKTEAIAADPEEDSKWRRVRERTPEEIQAWVEEDLAKQQRGIAKAKERAKERKEQAELDQDPELGRDARDGTDSPGVERNSEQERQEERADKVAAAMGEELRRHVGKVVPMRRERWAEDREGPVEKKKARPRVIIDLITDEELYAKHFDPLVFLVNNMLAEGTLNILAGKPKIGKSFLALQIGRAVGAGLDLWPDCPCTKVPVLYLGLEDTPRRLKHRMIGQLGMGVRPKGGVMFATLWPRIGEEGEDGIAAIEETVERFGIRLVIIDTWARFRALSENGRGGTSYTQDYDDLAPLVDFCKRSGVAILLIHHTKKGESANIFDMISGSVGLQGAVDCEMVLTGNQIKDAEGGSKAVLSGSARDFEGFELELAFEPVPCTWKYVGKAAVTRAKGEQEAALEAMREHGGAMTPSALAREMGKKLSAAKMLLKRMLAAKLVAKGTKAGTYVVPE